MKISKLIFVIAVIIVGAWLLGAVFRFAAWLVNGLLYVAAIVIIIGLVATFIEQARGKK